MFPSHVGLGMSLKYGKAQKNPRIVCRGCYFHYAGVAALATLRLLARLLPLQPTSTDQQLLSVVSRARALVVGLGGERHGWPREGTGGVPESQGEGNKYNIA